MRYPPLSRIGLALFVSSLAACGGGGGSSSPAAVTANLSVKQSGPSEIVAGQSGVFSATVSNGGGEAATGVSLTYRIDAGFGTPTFSCVASGGAICPETLAPSMTVASLPAGGALAFTVTLPVPEAARGAFSATLTAAASSDADPLDNVASVASLAQDPRSGSYTVFATNGGQYTLAIDYVARTYRMSGTGVDQSGTFEVTGSGTAKGTGTQRWFRSGPGFIAGGFDFAAGQSQAFVAARSFLTDPAELAGDFNVAGVSVNAGVPDSIILSTRLAPSTYQVCTDGLVAPVSRCPAGSLRTYSVTRSGDDFLATAAGSQDLRFRVARVGGTLMYVRAERGTSSGDVFRIGWLPATTSSATTAGTTLHGMSTEAGWQTVVSTLTGGAAQAHTLTAQPGAALPFPTLSVASFLNAPEGVYLGQRASDSANTFVVEHPLMTYVVGARGGPMAGRAAIFVP